MCVFVDNLMQPRYFTKLQLILTITIAITLLNHLTIKHYLWFVTKATDVISFTETVITSLS